MCHSSNLVKDQSAVYFITTQGRSGRHLPEKKTLLTLARTGHKLSNPGPELSDKIEISDDAEMRVTGGGCLRVYYLVQLKVALGSSWA
jgi:hypothetical protein